MFPLEYQVNIHHGDGEVERFALLENQRERHLIVVAPSVIDEMVAFIKRGGQRDDGLVALLVEEVRVLDRKAGTLLSAAQSNTVLAGSTHPAIRLAGILRTPMPAHRNSLGEADLAWAFAFEVARRNVGL